MKTIGDVINREHPVMAQEWYFVFEWTKQAIRTTYYQYKIALLLIQGFTFLISLINLKSHFMS